MCARATAASKCLEETNDVDSRIFDDLTVRQRETREQKSVACHGSSNRYDRRSRPPLHLDLSFKLRQLVPDN